MGTNLDLTRVFNVPAEITCEHCKGWIPSGFRSYDIEEGEPNPAPGEWRLFYYCNLCSVSGSYNFKVIINGE